MREHVLYSKRNIVMMEIRKDTSIVRKEFKTLDALKKELSIYTSIQNRVKVPEILGRQKNTLLLSYIHGKTALEILEEQERIYQQEKENINWRIWDSLLDYIFLFYSEMNRQAQESMCFVELNLENFIYEEEEQNFYGVDFGHCQGGERECDFANLLTHILMHRPAQTEYKEALVNYLLKKLPEYMNIDMKRLNDYRKKEVEKIVRRRKQNIAIDRSGDNG